VENGLWSEVLNTVCNLYVEVNKESKMKSLLEMLLEFTED